jgi:ABC-type histidine transport system ATPase subunit
VQESGDRSVESPVLDVGTPMLDVVDIEVRYGAALALSGVSLQIPRGQMVALLASIIRPASGVVTSAS